MAPQTSWRRSAARSNGAREGPARTTRPGAVASALPEQSVALFVDDLPPFREGEVRRLVEGGEAVGTHEAMRLGDACDLLLDRTGRLELAFGSIGGSADQKALVLDLLDVG